MATESKPKFKVVPSPPDGVNDPRYMFHHPPCYYCKHLIHVGTQRSLRGWTCKAFPEEIPYTILGKYEYHTEVFLEQGGDYVYDSKPYKIKDGSTSFITPTGDWFVVVPVDE